MHIWPQDAAKCCKNAGKFFPDVIIPFTVFPTMAIIYLVSLVVIILVKNT